MTIRETKTYGCDVTGCGIKVSFEPSEIGDSMEPNNEPEMPRPWLPKGWGWMDLTYYGVRRVNVALVCQRCIRRIVDGESG